jgi:hypothetical protein
MNNLSFLSKTSGRGDKSIHNMPYTLQQRQDNETLYRNILRFTDISRWYLNLDDCHKHSYSTSYDISHHHNGISVVMYCQYVCIQASSNCATGKRIPPAFRSQAMVISILLRVSLLYRLLKLHYQCHNRCFNKITCVKRYVVASSRNHCCDGKTICPLLIVVWSHAAVNNIKESAVTDYHKLMTNKSQNVFCTCLDSDVKAFARKNEIEWASFCLQT